VAPPSSAPKPGRPLALIAALIAGLYVAMLLMHAVTPRLGLDLSGGTSVTLTAQPLPGTGGQVTPQAMTQAVDIIRQRVNAFGVSEADVAKQGSKNIVINVPGKGQQEVVGLVGQTALLRFRPVLVESAPGITPQPTRRASASSTPTAKATAKPGSSAKPKPSAKAKATAKATAKASRTPSGNGRVLSQDLLAAKKSPSTKASTKASAKPGRSATPLVQPSTPSSAAPTPGPTAPGLGQITPALQKQFAALDCTKAANRAKPGIDDPAKPLVACAQDGTAKYILDKSAVNGTEVGGASATLPQNSVTTQWQVNLNFKGAGTRQFGDITRSVVSKPAPQNQVAIVLDQQVVSAPQINEAITAGQAQITGSFSQKEATDLANVLKYGALPLAFEKSEITTISPTVGADQLRAGLLAGALGLALVVLYSLLYYRALGLVSVLSLTAAGMITYASVVLLGKTIGFALTLAGIAGLIVSIGITADSFIVFFERLRDEVRDGRTLRSAVEQGWRRARRTILVADAVSFLAAAVLYLLAIGSVKGFAFTLGLTTIVDVVVVFLFTKPMMSLLARTDFYGRGRRGSGLDPRRLGATDRTLAPSAVRRRSAGVSARSREA